MKGAPRPRVVLGILMQQGVTIVNIFQSNELGNYFFIKNTHVELLATLYNTVNAK